MWKKLTSSVRDRAANLRSKIERNTCREALTPGDLVGLDLGTALHHLRGDLKDDWFPDPADWEDLLDVEFLKSLLFASEGRRKLRRRHVPCKRQVRDVPKANGTLRYSLEQTIADRFAYQLIASELAWAIHEAPGPVLETRRRGGEIGIAVRNRVHRRVRQPVQGPK